MARPNGVNAMRNRWWAGLGLAAAVVMLAACGSSGSGSGSPAGASTPSAGSSATSSATGIKTASVSNGTVLVNSAGFTLYWFAIDTPTTSKCNGTCATFWPPVPASQKPASGGSLTGKWGSITRSDGTKQLTYAGHPLYTYKLDTAPGMDNGNGKNLDGGLWWAVTPTGAKLGAAAKPKASSTSSGGYGY
jgi:predicted lipoprotein with Yx(FWY)xxD motif